MRLKFTGRDRGNFSGGLLLVLPVCCRDRTERVLAVRATGVMVNIQVLPYRMEVHAIAMTQYCSLLKLAFER